MARQGGPYGPAWAPLEGTVQVPRWAAQKVPVIIPFMPGDLGTKVPRGKGGYAGLKRFRTEQVKTVTYKIAPQD